MTPRPPHAGPLRWSLLALAGAWWPCAAALAQFDPDPKAENPVFVDERPSAVDALARARQQAAGGNVDQAARTLAKLLDEHSDSLAASPADNALFLPVRDGAHELLLGSPPLLARFRELTEPEAARLLGAGQLARLEQTRLLTPQGCTAAISIARQRALQGRFDSAARTLLQLSAHPDTRAHAESIGATAALIARYTADGPVRARLGALTGAALPAAEFVRQAPLTAALGTGSGAALIDAPVNQPLGTGVFGDDSLPIQPLRWNGDEAALSLLPAFAREMRCWPVVGQRAVLFSNGPTATALDRVSLRRLWSVDLAGALGLPPDEQPSINGGLRRPATLTWEEVVQPVLAAGESLLVTVVGRDYQNAMNGEGPEHLVAVDAQTGQPRWNVPLRELDEQLGDCWARGPLVSDGHVVVVNLVKQQSSRRLVANVIVGVDALTGRRLWTRTVGSSGVLPFYRKSVLTDSLTASDDVLYRYDRLGVVGAYTIADGRPLWVRRLPTLVRLEMSPPQEPWLVHQPLVTRAGLVFLSPERDTVMVIDPDRGAVTAQRSADEFGRPEYLAVAGEHLLAVGQVQVVTVRLDQIETGPVKRSGRIGGPSGIRGRVTSARGVVLAPSAAGVTVFEPDNPESQRFIALDAPGSPLALPEGLLVIDDARAHMYCTWDVAAAHLKGQIVSAPADPAPAAELALLAERSERAPEMLAAADSALRALSQSQPTLQVGAARSQVVATLLRAVMRSAGQPAVGSAAAALPPGAVLTPAQTDAALDRAWSIAIAPSDRAAVLLSRAAVCAARAERAAVAGHLQAVLADAELAAAPAPTLRGSATAGAAAVDALSRAVAAGGRAVYAPFDAEFDAAASALPAQLDLEAVRRLGDRYPMAKGLPALWLRAALAEPTAGPGQRAAARALERGVQAAERITDAPRDVVGELNGSLVSNLIARSLLPGAADALARAGSRFPGVPLTSGGVPLDAAAIGATISRELAGVRRWPKVGQPQADARPQVLEGWVLMDPLVRPTAGAAPPFFVMHKGDDRRNQVALFGFRTGQRAGEAADVGGADLADLWYSEMVEQPWVLVKSDARGALFFVGEQAGGRLVRVDADTGKVAWQSQPFGEHFPADPPLRFGPGGVQPQRVAFSGELRALSEIVLAADERTITMVERAGRAVAVDADGGQVLWSARLPVGRIVDATIAGGQLVVVGEHSQPQPDGKLDRVAMLDARSGNAIAVAPSPVTGVRYIRTTTRGDLILGSGGSIVSINAADLETARTSWTLTAHPAASAWEAWLIDERLFLLGDDRSVWEVPATTGQAPEKPLDLQSRLEARTPISVWQSPTGHVIFATGRGVAVVDGKGGLVGVDGVNAIDGTVPPAITAQSVLLLAPGVQRSPDGSAAVWNIHRLDHASAKLQSSTPVSFAMQPIRMGAIDGRIAVSTSSGTVIITAP